MSLLYVVIAPTSSIVTLISVLIAYLSTSFPTMKMPWMPKIISILFTVANTVNLWVVSGSFSSKPFMKESWKTPCCLSSFIKLNLFSRERCCHTNALTISWTFHVIHPFLSFRYKAYKSVAWLISITFIGFGENIYVELSGLIKNRPHNTMEKTLDWEPGIPSASSPSATY